MSSSPLPFASHRLVQDLFLFLHADIADCRRILESKLKMDAPVHLLENWTADQAADVLGVTREEFSRITSRFPEDVAERREALIVFASFCAAIVAAGLEDEVASLKEVIL